jgi:DNA-binding protein H-NS
MSYEEAGRKYASHIKRTQPGSSVARHFHNCLTDEQEKLAQMALKKAEKEGADAAKMRQAEEAVREREIAERVGELKHIKSMQERIDEISVLAMAGAMSALYTAPDPETKKRKPLPSEQIDRKGLAACLAQSIAVSRLLHETDGMAKLQEKVDALAELMAKND